MAYPNQKILRILQDRYIDNPEDDDYIFVDDVDDYDEPEDVSVLMGYTNNEAN